MGAKNSKTSIESGDKKASLPFSEGFRKIKSKDEKRGLNDAPVSVEQVPVCKSILVSCISDNTTHDAIELFFESRRNDGGPVEKVDYVEKSGRAVVVFQDKRDMEKVLARHERNPLVLNQTQLSIKIYHEPLEDDEGDGPEDSGDRVVTAVDGASQTQGSQKLGAKTQQVHVAVDPDITEYVTTTAFQAQLNNSLAIKKSEITWKPNNKMAVIVYRGDDDSDSWQSECSEEVQNFFDKFAKCDVQVNKDFWEAVVAQVPNIRACLGDNPPLIKTIGDSYVARIVSLEADMVYNEEKVKSKLEEIYREETGKPYLKKKVPNVSEERLTLLKKIKFAEKIQEKNKELEIKLDIEGEEIYFEGPLPQFTEAVMTFDKQMADMIEKELTLSENVLEVLRSDEGLQALKRELESNNVEAVVAIDKDARIVGTSVVHADNAATIVKTLILEEKVHVDEKSRYLLKLPEWRQLCREMNKKTGVRVHRNNLNDTYVAGFRDDVTEVINKLNSFLENNFIMNEHFVCTSDMRKYLVEFRQEDLRSIEDQLKDFAVTIEIGQSGDDFDISGNREGLKRVRKKIDALIDTTEVNTFEVIEPGLRKYFGSGKGDRFVKSVEKDHDCAIQVQKNFEQKEEELHNESVTEDSASSSDGVDDDDDDDEGIAKHIGLVRPFSIEVIYGDLTKENSSNAIMNINSTNMEMKNAGELSAAIANACGPLVQQECNQLGKLYPGSAVITSGGNLEVPYIIHIIPGSSDKQHLQQCLEKGLCLADANSLESISIPCVGTGGFGLTAKDSAQVTFQALNAFSESCKSIRKVRVVVYHAHMMQEFLQEQQRQPVQDVVDEDSDSEETVSKQLPKLGRRHAQNQSNEHSVRICIVGKDKLSVGKSVECLKKGFSEACTTEKVESTVISQLSYKQIDILGRKAEDRDVKLLVEADFDRIFVRGEPTDVSGMVGEIWKEISERTKKKQEEEQAQVLSKNIEWSYERHGAKMMFGPKANAKIEMAHSKEHHTVQVSLRGNRFVIDLKTNTGRGERSGEQITLTRKVKGAEEGIALPMHWAPMPRPDATVHTVKLRRGSSEYQDVKRKFQATASGVNIQKIERVQNPHLYQSYMVRKQKMDKDTGGNSERRLFHGTDAEKVSHINTQGFNRSFCGAHGVNYGRGVYFARDAEYSLDYAGRGGGTRQMYLARVLVGQYCKGNSGMMVPPAKNPSRPEILYESVVDNPGNPSIFVVFYDNQCYPEYLITLQEARENLY